MDNLDKIINDLTYSVRPLTAKEIELKVTNSMSRKSVYKIIKRLVKMNMIKKVKFECEGYKIISIKDKINKINSKQL